MRAPRPPSSPGRCATARVVLVGDLLLRRRRRARGAEPADRRRPGRHERPGADHHRGAGALAGRGRAVRHRARRARDGRASRRSTEVRSISKYGLSVVTVVFGDDTDIYFARQLVARAHARGRGGRPRAVRHARDGPDRDRPRRGLPVRGARTRALTLMQLEEMLDWYIGPAAPHRARHRRGEQLRRRGQAVPGRARSEAPPGRRRLGRARSIERSRRRTPTPAAATSSTTASSSSSAPTGWSRASTTCARSSSARRRRASRSRSRTSATCASVRACAAARRRGTARARSWSASR